MKTKEIRKLFSMVAVLAMVLALLPFSAAAADYEGHWVKEYIDDATGCGWMSGYDDGTFRPDSYITQGEFASMLWRALGSPASAEGSSFNDVNADYWYGKAVISLYQRGIVSGYGNGTFGPSDTLTREMAFAMLTRAFNLTAEDASAYMQFSDSADISSWAQTSASALVERDMHKAWEAIRLCLKRALPAAKWQGY